MLSAPLLGGLILLSACVGASRSHVLRFGKPKDPLQQIYQLEREACQTSGRRHHSCRRFNWNGASPINEQMESFWDKHYSIGITFGVRTREVHSLMLDTGSRWFWVTGNTCPSPNCDIAPLHHHTRFKFAFNESSSFHTDHEHASVRYHEDKTASGFLGTDYVKVGSEEFFGAPFMVANNLSKEFVNVSDDGILGLAYPRNRFEHPRSLLEVIQRVTYFSLFLRRTTDDTANAGVFKWDEPIDEHCKPDFVYVNVVNLNDPDKNSHNQWQIDVVIELAGAARDVKTAVVDTGAPIIGMPNEEMDIYSKQNNLVRMNGTYTVACDARLTNLTFTINEKNYTIASEALIVKNPVVAPKCSVLVDEYFDKEHEVLLGIPFLTSFCSRWNFTKAAIGFSSPIH